jgi:O-antigen ligase
VVLGLAVAAQFADLRGTTLHRVDRLLDPSVSMSGRTSGRSDLVLGGWYIFLDHPFGVGTGGFYSAWADLGRREGLSGFQAGERFDAHAGWIKTLAENGVPGALLLMVYVGSFALAGMRRSNPDLRGLGILTTVVLGVAFLSTEFQCKGLWFLATAVTVLLQWPPQDIDSAALRRNAEPSAGRSWSP